MKDKLPITVMPKELNRANYYIDKVLNVESTDASEWASLFTEVMEWLKSASPEEEKLFSDSGAGEVLYMSV